MAVRIKTFQEQFNPTIVVGGKPNFLVYSAYFALCALTINTTFFVFETTILKFYFLVFMVLGYIFSYTVPRRWYVYIGQALDVLSLIATAYCIYLVYRHPTTWGTMLAQLLCLLLVMKSYKLFSIGDFFVPLMITLTLMFFSSLPSFAAGYVVSLFIYLILFGFALFTSQLKETTRMRRHPNETLLRFTYRPTDYGGDPPLSHKPWAELWPYISSGLKASAALAVVTFIIFSMQFFQVNRDFSGRKNSGIERAFAGTLLADTRFQGREDDVFTGRHPDQGAGTGTLYPGFSNEFNIAQGRLASLDNPIPVMTVKSNFEAYHRGRAFDFYNGRSWTQTSEVDTAPTIYLDDQRTGLFYKELNTVKKLSLDPQTLDKNIIRQEYKIEEGMPRTTIVFSTYQAANLELPLPTVTIDDEFNIRHAGTNDLLKPGNTYTVESYKLVNPGKILARQTYRPEDFPDQEFLDKYTQLPWDKYPAQFEEIKRIASQIVRDTPSQYEQVQKLIEYLRSNYNYSLEPPTFVPDQYDAVYYFLVKWEEKRGHCEYFASALDVMARSVGIPCRVVTGYAPGDWTLSGFIVRQRHAHAWVEVYFPYVGWVEFDPTPPTPWYEKGVAGAGSFVLAANNTIEELYIFDPGGYYRKNIKPKLQWALHGLLRLGGRFYYTFIKAPDTEEGRQWLWENMFGNPRWWAVTCGAIIAVLLIFEAGYWLALGPHGYKRRLITKRGRKLLDKLDSILMRKNILDEGYHTPDQIAAAAAAQPLPLQSRLEPLDVYLSAKYSNHIPVLSDYSKMRRGFAKLLRGAKHMRSV